MTKTAFSGIDENDKVVATWGYYAVDRGRAIPGFDCKINRYHLRW